MPVQLPYAVPSYGPGPVPIMYPEGYEFFGQEDQEEEEQEREEEEEEQEVEVEGMEEDSDQVERFEQRVMDKLGDIRRRALDR